MRTWIYRKLTRLFLKMAWYFSEDATYTTEYLHEIYNKVPDSIKNERVNHYYFYLYDDCKNQKEVNEWLKIEE